MEGNAMRRTPVFAGWLHAGLIVLAAGTTLLAQIKPTVPAPRVSAPAPRVSAPAAPHESAPAPRVSAPSAPHESAPRVSAPSAPAPRVSAPSPRQPAPAQTPRRTAPASPRAAAPGNPRQTTPNNPRQAGSGNSRPSIPNSPRQNAPNNPRQAGPVNTRPSTPNSPRQNAPNNPRQAGQPGRPGADTPSGRHGQPPASASSGSRIQTHGGGHMERGTNGPHTYRAPDGKTVARIQNGRVSQIQRPNTVIRRPAGGPRTVVVQRHGNTVVMARSGGRGYVQRQFAVGRRNYVQRTYYVNRVAYVRAYRPVMYHGMALSFYAPAHYYPVAFYSWAGESWAGPVAYPWGWGGDPWYGYYGSYFRPWGSYSRPSFWLTDYLIGSTLQAAFQARGEARDAAQESEPASESVGASAPMSDEVKQLIEAEVRQQLAEPQAEAQAEAQARVPRPGNDKLPPSFNDKGSHLFLASEMLEVENTATGETCVIGDGDAIQLNGGLPRKGNDPTLRVLASKGSNCPVGSTVSVPLTDLVEMHNTMRETVEKGLETLRSAQGTDNLPMLPAEAAGEPVLTAYAANMQPDPDVAQVIEEELDQADQIEREVMAGSNIPDDAEVLPEPGPAAPLPSRNSGLLATIRTGQPESDVVAILGQPLNVSFLGGVKKLYEYPSGKVIFTDGEVSEVQVSVADAVAPPPPAVAAPRRRPASNPGIAASPGTPGSGASIAVGQSESEVVAILGQPSNISFLGGLKKLYEYKDLKIIFVDGSVSELQ